MKPVPALISLLLALALSQPGAAAQGPEFGVEWAYSPTFFNHYLYNYLDDDGSRVNEEGWDLRYVVNANVGAHISWYLSDCWRLGVHTGYCGVYEGRRMVPTTLRATWLPRGRRSDGMLLMLDAGAGWAVEAVRRPAILSMLGGGYRLALLGGMSLDFMLGARLTIDSPMVRKATGTGYVPVADIRNDQAMYIAVSAGISLNF